jgi:hypothetical protein
VLFSALGTEFTECLKALGKKNTQQIKNPKNYNTIFFLIRGTTLNYRLFALHIALSFFTVLLNEISQPPLPLYAPISLVCILRFLFPAYYSKPIVS